MPPSDAELLAGSGLPGPRANLTLALRAAADATRADAERWRASGEEYLVLCAAVAYGHLRDLDALRALANDPRWRVREGVAMGLQALGDEDFAALLAVAREWAGRTPLEARAAAAGLCEPRLLKRRPERAAATVEVLAAITRTLPPARGGGDDAKALRKALGYCWSIALVDAPPASRAAFEALATSGDPDVRWIVRENLRKKRLTRLDATWADALLARLA